MIAAFVDQPAHRRKLFHAAGHNRSAGKARIDRHYQHHADFAEPFGEHTGLGVGADGDSRRGASLTDVRKHGAQIGTRLIVYRHDIALADVHAVKVLLRLHRHNMNVPFHMPEHLFGRLYQLRTQRQIGDKMIVHKIEVNIIHTQIIQNRQLLLHIQRVSAHQRR